MKAFISFAILAYILIIVNCKEITKKETVTKTVSAASAAASSASNGSNGSASAAASSAASSKTTVIKKTESIETDTDQNENHNKEGTAKSDVCSGDNFDSPMRKVLFSFTSSFLKDLIMMYPNTTVNCMPLGSYLILSILAYYSKGVTQDQLFRALSVNDKDQVRATADKYLGYVTATAEGDISTDNFTYVYADTCHEFTNDFKDSIFGKADTVNMSAPISAAAIINSQVQTGTNFRVRRVVPITNSGINKNTSMALFTTFFLEIDFQLRAYDNNTITANFYGTSETVKEAYLIQEDYFDYFYSEKLGSKVVKLQSKGQYSAILIMPDENTCLNSVLSSMKNVKMFDELINNMTKTPIKLGFPISKILTATSVDSLKIVKKYFNVSSIFDPKTAEFSGITVGNEYIYVNYAKQKVITTMKLDGPPPPGLPDGVKTMKLMMNRPYLYYILACDIPVVCGIQDY